MPSRRLAQDAEPVHSVQQRRASEAGVYDSTMQPPDRPAGILQGPSEGGAQGSDCSSGPGPDLRWKQATV